MTSCRRRHSTHCGLRLRLDSCRGNYPHCSHFVRPQRWVSCLPSPKGLPVISHDTRYRYTEGERRRDASDVSLSLKHVLYKSHVITRGHWLRNTIGWFQHGGQSGWRRVDLSGSWISGEAAIFYVTRDVITGLWQIPDGLASPASQCGASAAGTTDHKRRHYRGDTRGLHKRFSLGSGAVGWDSHKGLVKGLVQPNHKEKNSALI